MKSVQFFRPIVPSNFWGFTFPSKKIRPFFGGSHFRQKKSVQLFGAHISVQKKRPIFWGANLRPNSSIQCSVQFLNQKHHPIFASNFSFPKIGREFRPIFAGEKNWTVNSVHFLPYSIEMTISRTEKLDENVVQFVEAAEKLDGKSGP